MNTTTSKPLIELPTLIKYFYVLGIIFGAVVLTLGILELIRLIYDAYDLWQRKKRKRKNLVRKRASYRPLDQYQARLSTICEESEDHVSINMSKIDKNESIYPG